MDHVLAHRDGLTLTLAILFAMGAACPDCGHGTRVTSKRWAKCKRCGTRVRRRSADEVEAAMRAAGEEP
jgi:tRNA(Ile2) C34 agmatinyltransferase TiaS